MEKLYLLSSFFQYWGLFLIKEYFILLIFCLILLLLIILTYYNIFSINKSTLKDFKSQLYNKRTLKNVISTLFIGLTIKFIYDYDIHYIFGTVILFLFNLFDNKIIIGDFRELINYASKDSSNVGSDNNIDSSKPSGSGSSSKIPSIGITSNDLSPDNLEKVCPDKIKRLEQLKENKNEVTRKSTQDLNSYFERFQPDVSENCTKRIGKIEREWNKEHERCAKNVEAEAARFSSLSNISKREYERFLSSSYTSEFYPYRFLSDRIKFIHEDLSKKYSGRELNILNRSTEAKLNALKSTERKLDENQLEQMKIFSTIYDEVKKGKK